MNKINYQALYLDCWGACENPPAHQAYIKKTVGNNHYCRNCGKVGGKVEIDVFNVRVCAEKIKSDDYKYCGSSIRKLI